MITDTLINSLLHSFSFQCSAGLDQIKVFVEPLTEREGTSTQLHGLYTSADE